MCNNLECKYCGSNRINRDGIIYGKQRYYCRECKKRFREGEDNRIKYDDDKRERVIRMYLENVGLRSIERIEEVSEPLILKWIKNMGKIIKERFNEGLNQIKQNIENLDENNITKENIEILEIDEIVTYVKKNLKTLKQKNETLPSYGLLLIGQEVMLLDLKSEIELNKPIKNSLIK